jgi:hypothetical protein
MNQSLGGLGDSIKGLGDTSQAGTGLFVKYGLVISSVLHVCVGGLGILISVLYFLFVKINLIGLSALGFIWISFGSVALGIASLISATSDHVKIIGGLLLMSICSLWAYLYFGSVAFEELVHSSGQPSVLAERFESVSSSLFNHIYTKGSCTTAGTCSDIRTFMLMTYWLREAGTDTISRCFGTQAMEVLGNFFTKLTSQVKHMLRLKNDKTVHPAGTDESPIFCAVKGPMFETLQYVYTKISWVVFDFLFLGVIHVGFLTLESISGKLQ